MARIHQTQPSANHVPLLGDVSVLGGLVREEQPSWGGQETAGKVTAPPGTLIPLTGRVRGRNRTRTQPRVAVTLGRMWGGWSASVRGCVPSVCGHCGFLNEKSDTWLLVCSLT